MSFRATTWALDIAPDKYPQLTTAQRLVLIIVTDAVNDETRECFISIRRIMHRSGLSRRSVQYALAVLEDLGIITRQIQAGGSRNMPDRYRPNLYVWHADPAHLKVVPDDTQRGQKPPVDK